MKLEYDYRIGSDGLVFTLPADRQSDPRFAAEGEDAIKIERFIMECWQQAINACFPDPGELARLMASPDGQALIGARATDHLAVLLENFPQDLDRRHGSERRAAPRVASDRRRQGRHGSVH